MKKGIMTYIFIGLIIVGLLILIFSSGIIKLKENGESSAGEKCTLEPGYTEQEWREHMGHHPDLYKECLT